MVHTFDITSSERLYLKELAKKQLEYANLPIMEERKKLWYEHNSLDGSRPLIVMEHDLFQDDILELKCTSEAAKEIERNLLMSIVNHELIDDDKVVSPYYTVYWEIEIKGMDVRIEHAENSSGKKLGYSMSHPIRDLKADFSLLKFSSYKVDKEYNLARKDFAEEVIGDILPVRMKNKSLNWHITPSICVVALLGLENMMYSLVDYPDEMHNLYGFLKEDIMAYVRWQEKEGLLTLNNENDFVGSGSYGFTNELPSEKYKKDGFVSPKDLWVNMNSQETLGISSDMYGEFIFPYYYELAKEFGLVYYGCCEPVHGIWEKYISKLPNLRKVSISPWCNEEYMGAALRESKVIYSRKPSPNYIGVKGCFDETAFSAHISRTLHAAKGCNVEFIFRDIYDLSGDKTKPGRSVMITRELIDKLW